MEKIDDLQPNTVVQVLDNLLFSILNNMVAFKAYVTS